VIQYILDKRVIEVISGLFIKVLFILQQQELDVFLVFLVQLFSTTQLDFFLLFHVPSYIIVVLATISFNQWFLEILHHKDL